MTSNQLPPGEYTNAEGVTQYWDGNQWLIPVAKNDSPGRIPAAQRKSTPRWVIVVSIALAVVICGTCAYFVIIDRSDRRAAAAASAAAIAADNTEKAAAAEEKAEVELAAEKAADAEAAKVTREEQEKVEEREYRTKQVKRLEKSVLKTAKERVNNGYYSSKILKSTCMAVTGSSIQDLAETSTSFSCLAVTKENKDGTYSGYELEAVINWTTGEMTWS